MQSDERERLLTQIGAVLAEDGGFPINETLLYAEIDGNVVGSAIFKDLGDHILYRREGRGEVSDLIRSLNEQEVPERRWVELEYLVRDGKFDAVFRYPEDLDVDEDYFERRRRVVARYFGDKPIVYPSWDAGDNVFEF